jgi:anthranilate phosphoribosyltransferase
MSASTTDPERPAAASPPDPEAQMRAIIQRIATGPELSKDISRTEAAAAMRAILEGQVNPVRAGIFLIALRMKRETDEENLGILDALRESATIVTADVDEVVDVADPYDGFTRSLPVSPFLPAVLAACGVPAVSHGVERMGPKYGVTHRQVLRAAGLPVDLDPSEAAARLADPRLGWAYVDQRAFAPKLYALRELRSLIVKRPALTTVEVLIGPIRGRRRTHLVTGYVHKPYPRIYALLARAAGFDSALIVRGVEGGVIPSLRQPGRFYFYRERGAEQPLDVDPATLGITSHVRAVPLPSAKEHDPDTGDDAETPFDATRAAEAAAAAGREALEGRPGPAREALVYAAAMCLWHLGRFETPQAAAQVVRTVLDEGRAAARLVA